MIRNISLLVTRPNHDDTTRYISAWAKIIVDTAKDAGNKVLDLDGDRASAKEVKSMLEKRSPKAIFFNGHGSDICVTGQNNEVLIEAGKNDYLLKDKIIYALSCRSAQVLGPASIKKGTSSYIGYIEDFIFMYSPENMAKPLEDKTAELFLNPANQVMVSLLKGQTAFDSHVNAKKYFVRKIQRLLTSEAAARDSFCCSLFALGYEKSGMPGRWRC